MRRTGRLLRPRTVREWWVKGLLPRPCRFYSGRGKGSSTFWRDDHVLTQAQVVFDLLAKHRRTETTLVRLWLLGFDVESSRLKAAWRSLIGKARAFPRRPNAPMSDQVGALAKVWAKHWKGSQNIREQIEPLLEEALAVFFGSDDEIAVHELGVVAMAALSDGRSIMGLSQLPSARISDDDLEFLLRTLREYWSLPAQRAAIDCATAYELVRARRLWHVVLGLFARHISGHKDQWEACAVTFGQPLIPLLLRLLRERHAHSIKTMVLSVSLALRGRISNPRDAFIMRIRA